MRNNFLLIGIGVALMSSFAASVPEEDALLLEYAEPKSDSLMALVEAMIIVESGGNPNAYHAKEKAAGVLQIRPIMLAEVNRTLHKTGSNKLYTLEDRYDRGKSIEMFLVIADYHHNGENLEKIARCWNGGPSGMNKRQTKRYWRKVKSKIKSKEQIHNYKNIY